MQKHPSKLRPHEWSAVAVFLFILVFIVICNFVVNKREPSLSLPADSIAERSTPLEKFASLKQKPSKTVITIFLEGDVQPRGAYEIKKGATLKTLYRKLNKEALWKGKADRALKNEEVIKF